MRTLLLLGWLLLPAGGVAYHFGPGQDALKLDDADTVLVAAAKAIADQDWATADGKLEEALKLLPADQKDAIWRARLERAKAQMFLKKVPQAQDELHGLLADLTDADAAPELQRQTREALANTHYYMTWMMRLEGAPREIWEPEIEAARQNYKLLALEAEQAGKRELAAGSRGDLEATVRLARLEVQDLQGLPLPSQ